MAVGDVVSLTLTSVATGGNLDRQPSSGVEEVIEELYFRAHGGVTGSHPTDNSQADNAWTLALYDGSDSASIIIGAAAAAITGAPATFAGHKMRITNTNYARCHNDGGTTANFMSATGVQTA